MNNLDEFVGTTAVEELELSQNEGTSEQITCKAQGCEAVFKSGDEGVNVFMSYCHCCNIKLRVELDDMLISDKDAPQEDCLSPSDETPPADDSAICDTDDAQATASSPPALPTDGRSMDMEDISSALISLVRAKDSRQVATLNFGKFFALY